MNYQDYKILIDKILPYFGTVVAIQGVEADDLANMLLQEEMMSGRGNRVYLASSDKDWHTLLTNSKVCQVDTKGFIYTQKNLKEKNFELIL